MKNWTGQVTTGLGVLVGTPVVIAWMTGQITTQVAIPGIVAAVIGLVWPENKPVAEAAQTITTAMIPQLMAAYNHGLREGSAAATPVSLTK